MSMAIQGLRRTDGGWGGGGGGWLSDVSLGEITVGGAFRCIDFNNCQVVLLLASLAIQE